MEQSAHAAEPQKKRRRRKKTNRVLFRVLIVISAAALMVYGFHACSGMFGINRLSPEPKSDGFSVKEKASGHFKAYYPQIGIPEIDNDLAETLSLLEKMGEESGAAYAGADYVVYKRGVVLSVVFTVTGYRRNDTVCYQRVTAALYRTTDGARLQAADVFTDDFYPYVSERVRSAFSDQVDAAHRQAFTDATEPVSDCFGVFALNDSGCTLFLNDEFIHGVVGVCSFALSVAEIESFLKIEPDGTDKGPDFSFTGPTQFIEGDGKRYPFVKPSYSNADPSKPMICLTYDDGPGPETHRLLDVLEKYHARATFFVCGYMCQYRPEDLKRMLSIGCQIGNHTMEHIDLTELSDEEVLSVVQTTADIVEKACGERPYLFRPPYGSYNDHLGDLLGDYPFILWDVDTLDWQTLNTQATVDAVLNNAADHMIFLMHDIHESTVDAAEEIVSGLINQGYQLVTVEELSYYTGRPLVGGQRNL